MFRNSTRVVKSGSQLIAREKKVPQFYNPKKINSANNSEFERGP